MLFINGLYLLSVIAGIIVHAMGALYFLNLGNPAVISFVYVVFMGLVHNQNPVLGELHPDVVATLLPVRTHQKPLILFFGPGPVSQEFLF